MYNNINYLNFESLCAYWRAVIYLKDDKKCREVYAGLALITIGQIQEPFSMDWLQDRPDLQIGNFGIEVTEAISERQGEKRDIEEKMFSCKTIESLNKYKGTLTKPNKYQFDVLTVPDTSCITIGTGGGYNEEHSIKVITDSIEKKSDKFRKYPDYERFSRRGLYISAEYLLSPSHQLDKTTLQEATYNSLFDVVFIHCPKKIIEIRRDNEQILEYPFTDCDRDSVKCKALEALGFPEYDDYLARFISYYGVNP
jgi:hypothetical protein